MPPTNIQIRNKQIASGTSGSIGPGDGLTNPGAGKILVVLLALNGTDHTGISISDTIGNDWTPANVTPYTCQSAAGQMFQAWATKNKSDGTVSDTINVSWGVANSGSMSVSEWDGISSLTFDGTWQTGWDGGSVTVNVPTFTPTADGDLLFNFICVWDSITGFPATAPVWTAGATNMGGTGDGWGYIVDGSSGVGVAAHATNSGTNGHDSIIFGIKVPTGGTPFNGSVENGSATAGGGSATYTSPISTTTLTLAIGP